MCNIATGRNLVFSYFIGYIRHNFQECFPDSVPEAIADACYEMDVAFLESQHARLLVQQQKRRTADSLSPVGEAVSKSGGAPLHASGGRDGRVFPKMSRRGDDVRSRLGGLASNRAGGATAVVAVITRVGEVMHQLYLYVAA